MTPFVRKYDMRWVGRREFLRQVFEAEREAMQLYGCPVKCKMATEGYVTRVEFRPVEIDDGGPHVHRSIMDKIKKDDMSITGAKFLGDQFRQALADIKADIAKTGEEMTGAMKDMRDTAQNAKAQVVQIKREAAELRAALGLNSNNPPADDAA